MAFHQTIEQTVTGLGYDLVDVERSAGGLLRVTIDWPWKGPDTPFVTVEDCEKVTRQLQFVLEVEAVPYQRLEVSSPGIDRPLRHEQDFQRFAGERVDITLKAPLGADAAGLVHASRKKFRGTLVRPQDPAQGWELHWQDEQQAKPGHKVSPKRPPPAVQVLGFRLDELREARLAPVVDFKGRTLRKTA
ncbi:MAG: ribosome maturation factor RimP [Limnohabitans sp.]